MQSPRRYVLVGVVVVVVIGIVIFSRRSDFTDRVAAIPMGMSKEEVSSRLGKPMVVLMLHSPRLGKPMAVLMAHSPGHDELRTVWIYPGPLKFAPKISFSQMRISLFDRSLGPKIYFSAD